MSQIIWENVFKTREWGKYPDIDVVRFNARHFYRIPFEERRNVKILELGSGTGANLWYCAREGFSVFGLEYSSTALKKMKERFQKEGLNKYLLGSFEGDYYENLDKLFGMKFDAVIDVESLAYNSYEKTKEILRKIYGVLKRDGYFLSITFADGTYGLHNEIEKGYHFVSPTKGPLKDLGLTRYTTLEDIYVLYGNSFEIESIGRRDRYYDLNNSDFVIKEFIVEVRKENEE